MKYRVSIQMPLRLPAALHNDLKAAAKQDGLSLNQYCLYLLARHSAKPEELKRKKAEDLLLFLEEAHQLQKEMAQPQRQLAPDLRIETPLMRLRKLHGKN